MDTPKLPPFLPVLLTSLFLALTGWAGLAALILFTLPNLGPRWLFFFLTTLAVIGTALPVIYFFHRRFPGQPQANAGVIIRETVWVGMYMDILLWLQLGRALNLMTAAFLAVGLVVIEFVLRWREHSQWDPKAEDRG